MNNEISKEDLFRKIDKLKIRIFDTEDALKSAEIRIQELNKCNDYANEELDKYKNIIERIQSIYTSMQFSAPENMYVFIDQLGEILEELKGE